MRLRLVITSLLLAMASARAVSERLPSDTVIFSEPNFPTADSAEVSSNQLARLFPRAALIGLERLHDALASPQTRVLILPHGSAFPEAAWPDIAEYLQQGGNLLVIGGKPFTRAVFRDTSGWNLRDYSVRFVRQLMIDQYKTTPGSDGLEFLTNRDLPLSVPRFPWIRGFSPVIRLSAVDLYHRGGSTGSMDARVDSLAWGAKNGRKLSATGAVIDHLRNGYDGGRWIFLNAELPSEFLQLAATADFLGSLIQLASRGSQEFSVRPTVPLYLSSEPIPLEVVWHAANAVPEPRTLKVTTYAEARPSSRFRAADLHLDARSEPLVVHNAKLQWKDHTIPVTFDQQKQLWLNSIRFADGSTLVEIPWGQGRVFWGAYPVELAEGSQAAADLYSYVLTRAGIEPPFDLQSPVSPGVLVSATPLDDSVLYIFASEYASDAKIKLLDKRTGARIDFTLASQHAAVAVVSLKEKTVVAHYNF